MADRIAVMDHGVLQQVGTPNEVYDRPANLFVARFIGAPGMNLLPGTLAGTGGGLAVDLGPWGVSPPLPARPAKGAAQVMYGFRPEEVALASEGPGLRAGVGFVERIGARTIVHLEAAGGAVKAVIDNDVPVSVGENVTFHIPPGAVRLFDAASGAALAGA